MCVNHLQSFSASKCSGPKTPSNPQPQHWWHILLSKHFKPQRNELSGHLMSRSPTLCLLLSLILRLHVDNCDKVRFSCDSFGFLHTPASADQALWQLAPCTSTAQLSLPLPRLSRLSAPSCSQINVGPSDAMQETLWKVPNRSFCSGNASHEANVSCCSPSQLSQINMRPHVERIIVFFFAASQKEDNSIFWRLHVIKK